MRRVPLFLALVLIAALSSACAGLDACPQGQTLVNDECTAPPPPCEGKITKPIPVGCVLSPSLAGGGVAYFNYELDVEPTTRIASSTPFQVVFGGRALIGTDLLNLAQVLLTELNIAGFRRIAVEDFQATVQVRQGASEGNDIVLKASLNDHWTCTYDEDGKKDPETVGPFPPCSPENDHDDLSNEDCIGLGGTRDRLNRCLAYFEVPTNDDCREEEGGVCFDLGLTGPDSPCETNDFCATKNVEIPLEQGDDFYIADSSGWVLFGWADRGFDLLEAGPNRGAYDPSKTRRGYNQEPGANGMRLLIGGVPLALECIMGVNSRDLDGVPTIDPLLSPSPDGILISCPIEEP